MFLIYEKHYKANFARQNPNIETRMKEINKDDHRIIRGRFQQLIFNQCMGFASEIHLVVLAHFLLRRLIHKDKMGMLETTLELLQRISVKIVQPSPKRKCFRGNGHTCQLFCSRCNKKFGPKGPFECVLARTPVMVLIHYGFLPEKRPKKYGDI